MKDPNKKYNTQSMQDFLEKGGSVKVLPPAESKYSNRVSTQAISGHSSLMSLDDAAVFHGEVKPEGNAKLRKELAQLKATFDLYPKPLQDKEVARLRKLVKAGEIEDNGYFDKEDEEE